MVSVDQATYEELTTGVYRLSILESYDALTDTPVVPFYPQLDANYPGSKFILTVRERSSWLKSCEKYWHNATIPGRYSPYWQRFAFFIDRCVYGCYSFSTERYDYVYDQHVANVRRYFEERPDDLLVLDVVGGDGWEPLCQFLGKEVPDQPFPKITDPRSPLLDGRAES